MSWSILIAAIGLLFVFEGILPFLSPDLWRRTMQQMSAQSDKVLRVIGFVSMLLGLGLVCLAREIFN